MRKLQLFALGGNEISPIDLIDPITGKKKNPDIKDQWERTAKTCKLIASIVDKNPNDYYVVSHGNGPQVGNILRRSEISESELFHLPLDICVADTQGAMGYMLNQLNNYFQALRSKKSSVSVVTQVEVDRNDPAFLDPGKFIGSALTKTQAVEKRDNDGWQVKLYKTDTQGEEIWRRVVPSPMPKNIVELNAILTLLKGGIIPIATGGGGIPVAKALVENGQSVSNYGTQYGASSDNIFSGVEAVIDKDLTTSLLGTKIIESLDEKVEGELFIFTNVDGAKLDFQTPHQKDLRVLTVSEAEDLLEAGKFPGGSMKPKIQAGVNFVKNGGSKAFIAKVDLYEETMAGTAGTTIIP